MAEQLIVKNLPFIKVLPAWAQELSYKYCSKTANLYLLSGNIRDFLPHKMKEGEFNFVKIQDYVSEVLFGNRDIIVFYDRSSGVSFCKPEMKKDYLAKMKQLAPQGHAGDAPVAQSREGPHAAGAVLLRQHHAQQAHRAHHRLLGDRGAQHRHLPLHRRGPLLPGDAQPLGQRPHLHAGRRVDHPAHGEPGRPQPHHRALARAPSR